MERPTFPQTSKVTRKKIAQVFDAQRAFVRRTRPAPLEARRDRLRRLQAALDTHQEAFREALYADFRKPAEEVDLTDLYPVQTEARHALEHLRAWMRPARASAPWALLGTTSRVRYAPKGVVLILSPWNYPVALTLGPLVSALAAGNSAVLKPSEFTPHTSAALRELVSATFDETEVALFEGDAEMARTLLEHPFDHVFFTGSPRVGKHVMQAAAGHLSSVTLELGGKTPALVDRTADVKAAARKIVWGKFVNAGQTCIAPDYVLVQRDVYAPLVAALRRALDRSYGHTEAERRASADYARIVSDRHFRRLQALLDDAVSKGATIVEGGQTHASDRYVAPTLLTDVPPEARVRHEEIFGPILPILPFRALDEALEHVNRMPRPLVLYVFSTEDAHIDRMLARTVTGGCCINEVLLHYQNPYLPFGGAGRSGMGRAHGVHGFRTFSNEQAVLRRRFGTSLLERLYPPYAVTTRRLIDVLLRWF